LNIDHLETGILKNTFPGDTTIATSNHQAIKKPGLNACSAGIPCVPGLFSKLFNVAASRPAQMTTKWKNPTPHPRMRQGGSRSGAPGMAETIDVFFAFGHRPA